MEMLIGGGGPQGPGDGQDGAGGPVIMDSDTPNFVRDVIDASTRVPIVVDFWAPWCGPCKQLTPMLEKLVTAQRGKVRLVKINIDENQDLAAQLRVQSIPAVYAFFQGRPVDGFVGGQPESQLKAFVERLAQAGAQLQGPSALDEALEQARAALESGDAGTAAAIYEQVVQHEPEHAEALAGLILARIASGDHTGAQMLYDSLSEELRKEPALAQAAAALALAAEAGEPGSEPALRARIQADPGDLEARFELAGALIARGERAGAAEELLAIMEADRAWNEDAARKQLIKYFEAWGPTDKLTQQMRRRLSTLLFS